MLRGNLLLVLLGAIIWHVQARSYKSSFRKQELPKLNLPWGTYRGELYGEDEEVILFKNIRFAKPPVGALRFAAPQYPDAISDNNQILDNNFGPNCMQASATADAEIPEPPANGTQSEDCLFLDVYVPSWAFEDGAEKLPVVVWIYGGAYVFGGKNTTLSLPDGPFSAYDGTGLREVSNEGVIWVTGNYRLGAYGFLAGSSMEKNAQPNAGLHDQRLLLDWVQRYIDQIGGDNSSISAWGLSAGAGSILHHLTAYGGAKNEKPLFNRAVMWSTAFQWAYDRAGTLEETFRNFTSAAKCGDAKDAMKCLRNADNEALRVANQKMVSERIALGMFPFGPAIDGDMVPALPSVLLSKGQHVNVSSLILSHAWDEASMFLADWIKTEADFSRFANIVFPGDDLAEVRKEIEKKYPSNAYDDDQQRRTNAVVRDSSFVCNNHQIYMAFKDQAQIYAARYEIPPARHGSDLMPIIWSQNMDIAGLIQVVAPRIPAWLAEVLQQIWAPLARRYQTYLAGHAINGDPNLFNSGRALDWETATDDGDELTNAMKIGLMYTNPRHPFYKLGSDNQVSATSCDFWDEVAETINKKMNKGKRLNKKPMSFKTQILDRLRGIHQIDL